MANRAHDLEARIQELISSQRYEEAQGLLPEYGKEVVANFNRADAERDYLRAKTFAKAAIREIAAQKAHDADRLTELTHTRVYLKRTDFEDGGLDVSG